MALPVLILSYKRPDTLKRVLDQVGKYQPPIVYIANDGPNKAEDKEGVAACRKVIADFAKDHPTKTLLRESNLGCRLGVTDALHWFFSFEEYGIVLEEDCLPHPDFFTFCEAYKDIRKDIPEVSVVSGCNMLGEHKKGNPYLSQLTFIWGWASWSDVVLNFEPELKHELHLPILENRLKLTFPNRAYLRYKKMYDLWMVNEIDSWAFPFFLNTYLNNRLTLIPRTNLVANIGFSGAHYAKIDPQLLAVQHTWGYSSYSQILDIKQSMEDGKKFEKRWMRKVLAPNKLRKAINLAKLIWFKTLFRE